MTEDAVQDQAHDPGHELTDGVVQRVFYVVSAGPYTPSPEFSTREQAVAYAQERRADLAVQSVIPATVEIDVRAEYLLRSGRRTKRTVETFSIPV